MVRYKPDELDNIWSLSTINQLDPYGPTHELFLLCTMDEIESQEKLELKMDVMIKRIDKYGVNNSDVFVRVLPEHSAVHSYI